jgi:dCMP deaminase
MEHLPALKTAVKIMKARWDVLHAEANAILKVARSTQSCEGSTYITLSPCKECSKLIHQSGIKRVVYHKGYRDDAEFSFNKSWCDC